MTPTSRTLPVGSPRPELPVAEPEWLALWRAFWLDLPVACAHEIGRLSLRCLQAPAYGSSKTDTP
ncbi:hypothetical protein [Methylorubrum suomiense]|uniref:Uncharacterized protein n=1 Tax=Methylorubrum suomiense TaxID=144191 RepID=A0ABQ4UQN2_9HYPH|nr:hypothetical protein [Methylorubrum suomiense]GJE74300.1 hypothetical protein BGCPKDLD_0869 [Methylorubrum suomiense]